MSSTLGPSNGSLGGPPPPTLSNPKRIVVGVSGASGAAYALRLIEQLLIRGHEVHLVVSDYGRRLLFDEAGITHLDFANLCPTIVTARVADRLIIHPNKDVGAVIASGSFLHDGMVVVPCSSTSLGAIATSSGSNLLTRAAMVTLKERRPLILCHRETPLNHIDIINYQNLSLAGAIICPTNPGFYLKPKTIEEIVDFMVGKIMDLLRVEHDLKTRWGAESAAPAAPATTAR
ncbi:MAG: UbiX family flavin prenyltransferase [Phycisphaerales bacterium]|nr:UbiX family flavin prenyltransferase [Phycisphaerales bacterium]